MSQEKMHLTLRELKKVKRMYKTFEELEKHHNENYKNAPYFISRDDYFSIADMNNDELIHHPPIIAWGYSKLIYRFDVDAEQEIKRTKMTDSIPSDIFTRMPAWCIFIESNSLTYENEKITGFFVNFDFMEALGGNILSFLFYYKNNTVHFLLPLIDGGSLINSIEKAQEIIFKENDIGDDMKTLLSESISLLLFICTQNSDITRHKSKKVPTKSNGFTIENDIIFNDVALAIGNAIRLNRKESQEKEKGEGSHRSRRPHIRRAHWHGYWSGKRDEPENRKYDLKWLPPFAVGIKDSLDIPATIHRVKK
ncbi:AcrVA2 family anti-CRISPR protein [Bisgaard Taxon 45]